MNSNFEKELQKLLNKHSIENGSNTPDFILSWYLMNCLQTLNILTDKREDWYGRKPKEMEGTGFKDVGDCSWNKSVESGLMACNPKYLNENSMCLSKQDSGLEKIIKYVSKLNHIFGHPYYFTWSLANNYYDESPSGVIKDPSYASLRVGRHMATGKNLEMLLLFGPINSIVDTNMAFRFLIEPKNGEIKVGLSDSLIPLWKGVIDKSLHEMYGNSWDDFNVVPPAEGKPLPIPQDDIKQSINLTKSNDFKTQVIPEVTPNESLSEDPHYGWDWTKGDIKDEVVADPQRAVADPYLEGADLAIINKSKNNPYDVNKDVHKFYNFEMGYEQHKLINQIVEQKELIKLLRKQNQEYGERAETKAKKLEVYVEESKKREELLKAEIDTKRKFLQEYNKEIALLRKKIDDMRKEID